MIKESDTEYFANDFEPTYKIAKLNGKMVLVCELPESEQHVLQADSIDVSQKFTKHSLHP